MRIFIITIILLSTIPCYALNGDSWMIDALYAESSFIGAVGLQQICNQSYEQSIIQCTIAAAFKEVCDQMYSEGIFGAPRSDHWFLDARGGDGMDVFWAAFGAACTPVVFEVRSWTVKIGWLSKKPNRSAD